MRTIIRIIAVSAFLLSPLYADAGCRGRRAHCQPSRPVQSAPCQQCGTACNCQGCCCQPAHPVAQAMGSVIAAPVQLIGNCVGGRCASGNCR